MQAYFRILALALVLICGSVASASAQFLKTTDRFLVTDDGTPFFWLGDTAWEIFHRLSREEARYYLRNRAAKGFTVVQAVLLGEINGVTVPNKEGELPLVDMDPARPNERFFDLVEHVVDEAAEMGLYVALLQPGVRTSKTNGIHSSITCTFLRIQGDMLRAWWYDPRSGDAYPLGNFENGGSFSPSWEHRIRREMGGPDWVLVVDDATQDYPPPGTGDLPGDQ